MKPHVHPFPARLRRSAGATLIECLVYIVVFATLLGVATSAFYHCYDHMRSLRRNADDITRLLRIGEMWRGDVRQAIVKPAWDETGQTLHLVHRNGSIDYQFINEQIRRRVGADAGWTTVLTNLTHSQMRWEEISGVAVCRWEVELKPLRKPSRVQPLFSFTAVPAEPLSP